MLDRVFFGSKAANFKNVWLCRRNE